MDVPSKTAQRKDAAERRRALTATVRREMSAAICRAIGDLDEIRDARTVMSYMAFGYEADMRLLHDELRRRGVRLCFPVCGSDAAMEAYAPEDGAFTRGSFCILEPDVASAVRIAPEDIDTVIVPCVAFDAQLRRIGQGGGFYDRFLPRCTNAFRVAAAFSVQRVDSVAAAAHDAAMSAVVTEERIYR